MSVRDFEAERQRHHQELDAAYRAIGRYVVEFSFMVACMKIEIADRIAETESRGLAQLVLGEAPAKQASDAFFAVCMAVGELGGPFQVRPTRTWFAPRQHRTRDHAA